MYKWKFVMLSYVLRMRQVRSFQCVLSARRLTTSQRKTKAKPLPLGDDDLFEQEVKLPRQSELNFDDVKVIHVDDDFDIEAALEGNEEKEQDAMAKRLKVAAKASSTGRVAGYHDYVDDSLMPSRDRYSVAVAANTCPGCGVKFQSSFPARSGYLPEDIKQRLESSPEEIDDVKEMEAILADARRNKEMIPWDTNTYIDTLLLEDGKSPSKHEKSFDEEKQIICKRCHSLRYGSTRADALRATLEVTGDDECLSAEAFELLLKETVKEARGVVILFVDLFDVDASLNGWKRMGDLVGSADRKFRRRVLVAANKFDLLPKDVSRVRLIEWVRKAVTSYIPALRDHLGPDDVFLMSAKTGLGVNLVLDAARADAARLKGNVYAVGAANAGKSTFINRAIGAWVGSPSAKKKKLKKKKLLQPQVNGVTASNAPGTTLGLVRVASDSEKGVALYDTPGLLTGDSLATHLTADELKLSLPTKPLTPASLRLSPGQTVLLGGFARIDFLDSDYGAFYLTFCFSDGISLHPTTLQRHTTKDHANLEDAYFDFADTHIGTLLKPPFDLDRFHAIQANTTATEFTIQGKGWEVAAADIVLSGLGWFSITGSGSSRFRITAPQGILVTSRDPLLPFEARYARATFTGGKLLHPSATAGGHNRKKKRRSSSSSSAKKK